MVAVGRRPSADLFVVSVGADQREAAARRLATLGQVTELSGNSGLLLLRVGRKAAKRVKSILETVKMHIFHRR